jgi:hypothetical protein
MESMSHAFQEFNHSEGESQVVYRSHSSALKRVQLSEDW